MQYEFLKNFPKRMKNVGLYGVLIQNSIQKTSWKQFGFLKFDEQMNLIFAVMLYIMEQSLREENCTMDDIGAYIDTINTRYLGKEISYDDCRKLGDFVVNVILSNEGRAMYFDGYDFEENDYHVMHISYVANRIVYLDQEVRRTSYYLTDDGYNLILSTLEIENNMKLTIHVKHTMGNRTTAANILLICSAIYTASSGTNHSGCCKLAMASAITCIMASTSAGRAGRSSNFILVHPCVLAFWAAMQRCIQPPFV